MSALAGSAWERSKTFAVLSARPATRVLLSAPTARERTAAGWGGYVTIALPLPAFQVRMVLSAEPVTTFCWSFVKSDGADGVAVAGERADFLAVVEVEDLGGLVGGAGEDLGAVGVDGDGEDRPLVSGEDADGGGLPDAELVVGTGGDDLGVVGQDGDAGEGGAVGAEVLKLAAVGGVPEADGVVGGAGGDLVVVVGEPDGVDGSGVAVEGGEVLGVADLPELGGLVGGAGQEALAVAADVQAEDGVAVAAEVADRFALVDVPELGGLVGGGGEEEVAVIGGEGEGVDPGAVAGHRLDLGAVGDVVNADLVVLAGGGEPGAVGRKARAVIGAGRFSIFLTSAPSATLWTWTVFAFVAKATWPPSAFEGEGGDDLGGGDFLDEVAVGGVPDADNLVVAGGGDLRAVGIGGEDLDGALGLDDLRFLDRELPEAGEAVGAGGDEELIVRGVGEAEDGVGGGFDHALRGAVGGVPEADGAGLVAGGDLLAVGALGDGLDVGGVAVEVAGVGVEVPELDGRAGGDGEVLAVGAEGLGVDAGGLAGKLLRGAGRGAGPDLGGLVEAAGEDLLAIGAGGDGEDEAGVSLVLVQLLAAGGVPDADGVVEAAGEDHLAVGRPGDGIDGLGVAVERADQLGLLGEGEAGGGEGGEGQGEESWAGESGQAHGGGLLGWDVPEVAAVVRRRPPGRTKAVVRRAAPGAEHRRRGAGLQLSAARRG